MGDRQWFVLYVLVCLEIGVFLVLVPWSAVWERNYFLEAYPALRPFLLDPAVKGAVAGLGLANVYVGLSELFGRWATRARVAGKAGREEPRLRGGETAGSEANHGIENEQGNEEERDRGTGADRARDAAGSTSERPLVTTATRR